MPARALKSAAFGEDTHNHTHPPKGELGQPPGWKAQGKVLWQHLTCFAERESAAEASSALQSQTPQF